MSEDTIRACIDRLLDPGRRADAARRALDENPANAPIVRVRPALGVAPVPLPPQELALLVGKKWQNGKTLRVRFLDGDPAVQAKVQKYAQDWSRHANITFTFGADPNAEIRISFRDRGSWSYLGTDALAIARNQATMNFGWLTPTSSDDEYSRVVVHEFGHALGCIHEHQNPTGSIPWDKPAVYRYYMGPPNNWTKEQVDTNLFQTYSRDITNFSQFDPRSIMLYPIPNEFTIGDFEVGWNTQLSARDIEFIGTMYPKDAKPMTDLAIGAPATDASIGRHGEEDLFRFVVTTAGRYAIETEGQTDVVMGLFGPNNQTTLIAEDDDSGQGFNAKIVTGLQPGTYYLRVRHYRPTGTGKYRIAVRARS